MDKDKLISDLKLRVIESLNLQDFSPEDLDENLPLFSDEGLGLDSVDALELVVMVETSYAVSIGDKDEAKNIFSSISALADFIIERKNS